MNKQRARRVARPRSNPSTPLQHQYPQFHYSGSNLVQYLQDELHFQDIGPYERELESELAEGLWEQLATETESAMSSVGDKRTVNLTGILMSAMGQKE